MDRFDMCSAESKSIRASQERKYGFEKRTEIPFLVGPLFRVIESEETYSKRVKEQLEKTINLTCIELIYHEENRRTKSYDSAETEKILCKYINVFVNILYNRCEISFSKI